VKIAVITLSKQGSGVAARLREDFPEAELFLHESVPAFGNAVSFGSILSLTGKIFPEYEGLIYIAPCGVAVRAIAPMIKHKTLDPAVVVVDAGGRHAVSLLSGHEGGANDLALRVANSLGAEPVISTTTDAVKTLIVGVGCRRGVSGETVANAVIEGLRRVKSNPAEVRMLASADIKKDEKGLMEAAGTLRLSLRFISSDEIISTIKQFRRSEFVASKVGLPAVAEPCALLAGRKTRLILPKNIIYGVTVAIAREGCL
jgi:cobalt-precorrin 5A hydrolase